MLILISPAKTLDFSPQNQILDYSIPQNLEDSDYLIKNLRKLSLENLSQLMGISAKLAQENLQRYQDWELPFTPANAKQAILAFKGDVYLGLNANRFTEKEFYFAQSHLRILSGLYGILKPLDLIQPYRLEMGTEFCTQKGKNIYHFWGKSLTERLNHELEIFSQKVVINLASVEYFKVIDSKNLQARLISPVFKEYKNGKYQVVSFFAKKARGLMSAFIIQNQLQNPEHIQAFQEENYRFEASLSNEKEWVFVR